MIFKKIFCSFFLLATQMPDVFAEGAILPKHCAEIEKNKHARAFLFYQDRLWGKDVIPVGEFEPATVIQSREPMLLITRPKKAYSAMGSSGSDKIIELKEMKAICKNTRQYQISWKLYPTHYGVGKFDSELDFNFDGPEEEYMDTTFNTKFQGVIHGPWADHEADNELLQKFMQGKSNVASFKMFNSGDRPLTIGTGTLSNLKNITLPLKISRSECDHVLAPKASCKVELQRTGAQAIRDFSLGFSVNSVGAQAAVISFDLQDDNRFKISMKHWE